jgi:hypothetical protein
MNRLSMEVPIFLKLRMLWNGPLRNLATQPVSWPVKIETALITPLALIMVYKKLINLSSKIATNNEESPVLRLVENTPEPSSWS